MARSMAGLISTKAKTWTDRILWLCTYYCKHTATQPGYEVWWGLDWKGGYEPEEEDYQSSVIDSLEWLKANSK